MRDTFIADYLMISLTKINNFGDQFAGYNDIIRLDIKMNDLTR